MVSICTTEAFAFRGVSELINLPLFLQVFPSLCLWFLWQRPMKTPWTANSSRSCYANWGYERLQMNRFGFLFYVMSQLQFPFIASVNLSYFSQETFWRIPAQISVSQLRSAASALSPREDEANGGEEQKRPTTDPQEEDEASGEQRAQALRALLLARKRKHHTDKDTGTVWEGI